MILYMRVAMVAALALASFHAAAQGWKPSRPVAFISPSSPAGSLDLTARLMQKIWDDTRAIGVPIVVINKPGAGNGIAWNYLNDRSDGHAISIGNTNLVSNQVTGAHNIGHRDVTPLALLFDDYFVLVVRADSPLKSMADVRDRLQADAGAVAIGFGPGLGAGGTRGRPSHRSPWVSTCASHGSYLTSRRATASSPCWPAKSKSCAALPPICRRIWRPGACVRWR